MSEEQIRVLRQWLSTLPKQGITVENACHRILIALGILTGGNTR